MNIDVRVDPSQKDRIRVGVVRNAASAALAGFQGPGLPALTVVLTGDAEIQALNLEYMGIDEPTDVLSFPSGDPPAPEEEEAYLGDIMISLERAVLQADAGGHALEQEVELLTVHGILHLLGHDHADEDEKAGMWAVQAELLNKLGNPLSPP